MKHLWIKYLSLILILAQTSILFADTLIFINGQKITGSLISLDKNNISKKEVVFGVDKWSKRAVPEQYIISQKDHSLDFNTNKFIMTFHKESVYKITNDNGKILFLNQNELADSSGQVILGLALVAGAVIFFLYWYVSQFPN